MVHEPPVADHRNAVGIRMVVSRWAMMMAVRPSHRRRKARGTSFSLYIHR